MINSIVPKKHYNNIIDVFMGSGNILFNINAIANKFIGNDIISLMPQIYNVLILNKYKYNIDNVNEICYYYNNFSENQNYYNFRKDWNIKYKSNYCSKSFILETIMLFKMCSNSMVRFNSKGEFNQGYRGATDAFFNEIKKNNIINDLNKFILHINDKFNFTNYDCIDLINNIDNENNLLILDPPYVLSCNGTYNNKTYDKEKDLQILNYLHNTKNDFIYFNYLTNDNIDNTYKELNMFYKKYNYKIINNKNSSGQNRKSNVTTVNEIMVFNF